LLERAAFLADSSQDGAVYLRSLAVLRWEQGRPQEAQALLASILPNLRRPTLEAARARLLLGLLHLLEGALVARPAALLRFASSFCDAARDTLPALFARLGLALALAERGDLASATEHRRGARGLWDCLGHDPAALAYPTWLDARVAAATEPGEGAAALRAARQ